MMKLSLFGYTIDITRSRPYKVETANPKSFLPQSPFVDSVSDMHVITRAEWVKAIDSGNSKQESTDNVDALFEKFMTYC